MRLTVLAAATLAVAAAALVPPARAQDAIVLPKQSWSFSGAFGTYDRAAAQRGSQVYMQVCANCHSLKQAYYRDLIGISLSENEVEALAGTVQVPAIGDDGAPVERKALPSDHFRSPFANEKAARAANNGALPPDLSVIISGREGGADYIYALLTGYADAPSDLKMADGMYYNKAFIGHQIGMPQPLNDDQMTYADGTKASMEQEARDVVTFLSYISAPEMETRKRLGVKVILFLVMLTAVTYAVKRKIWSDVEH